VPVTVGINYTGYKFTFVKKRNAQGAVVRHKARLVAKGYTQIFGPDYNMTYSPIMDSITYQYLILFGLYHNLKMHLMDVVTAYLYGILDTRIYMKAPPKLITRAAFHIKGEKPLPPDLLSGLQQMTLMGTSRDHANRLGPTVQQTKNALYATRIGPTVPQHDGALYAARNQTTAHQCNGVLPIARRDSGQSAERKPEDGRNTLQTIGTHLL
jgi:hypothetical protein